MKSIETYIKERLLLVSPIECCFKVGDEVIYTNEYGVVFEGLKVIGFSPIGESYDKERFIHLNTDCYWFPNRAKDLQLVQYQIEKSENAKRVLQLMDSCEDGYSRYQEFVKKVSLEYGISIEQLERELVPFI
jgi:hypothetical protein